MRRKALFIGVNKYTNGLPELSCAANDATVLQEFFEDCGYGEGMQIDPIGLLRGDKRVMRGGGAYTEAYHCRSAFRNSSPERTSYDSVGFRPVMILPDGLNWD